MTSYESPTFPDPDTPEVAQPFEYELLKGHNRTDGSFKSDDQLRTEYIELTDELVRKMTEGVTVQNKETRELETKRPDYVIWLDKSARPVSWLTRELWPLLATDKDGVVPEMPKFGFVNIDREQWVNTVDPDGSGRMDINRVDDTVVRSLRSIFVSPKYKREGLTPDIDTAPSQLDGKTVLIVDEVNATGRTLDIAAKFFERAFPSAQVAGAHWMGGVAKKGEATGNADLPVWYKENDVRGRGIGNRDEVASRNSKSRTQRLGGWFLSTRLGEPDESSIKLRKELQHLAQDAANKEVLIVPSLKRDLGDFDERAERLNAMSVEELAAKRQAQAQAAVAKPKLGER